MQPPPLPSQRPKRTGLRWVGGIISIVFLVGCVAMIRGCTQYGTYFDLSSVDWLPISATGISYHRDFINLEYECTIPEAEFVRLMKSEEITLKEISTPVIVHHSFIRRDVHFDPSIPYFNPGRFEVKNGLFYEFRQENNGGYFIVYDRTRGIAYYQWAHH